MARVLALLLLFQAFARADTPVRVSILSLLSPHEIELTLKSGRGTLKMSGSGHSLHPGETLTIQAGNGTLAIDPLRWNGNRAEVQCPQHCEIAIQVPGQLNRLYHGDLALRATNSTINIVLISWLEELVGSVTASEMSTFHEPEAWKSFAVVARTFMRAGARHPELGADLCDTTHCQVFQGYAPAPDLLQAVQSTRGLTLTYRRRVFRPFYSLSCGGTTATYEEVWRATAPDYPFFSVHCAYCSADKNAGWSSPLTNKQLEAAIGLPHPALEMKDGRISVSDTSMLPEDFRILIGRALGWKTLPGNDFSLQQNDDGYAFTGRARGHRVGLCQKGAVYLAQQGKTFREILSTYFPNTELR